MCPFAVLTQPRRCNALIEVCMIYGIDYHLWTDKSEWFVYRHTGEVAENGDYVGYDWIAEYLSKEEAEKFAQDCRDGVYSEEQIQEFIDKIL